MVRTKEYYQINEDHIYRFKPGDKVRFYDYGSDTHKDGVIKKLTAFARWKVTVTRTGWWIFGKSDYKYKPFEPSYTIITDDKQAWIVDESDINLI